ncbi:MAG: CBS domain-containing protein [Gaiellaceae bacterium]
MKVEDLMRRDVITVAPETSLKDVAELLVEHRISGVPVVDQDRAVVGVVSEADILIKERGPEPRHAGVIGWLLDGGVPDDERLAARTAGEAMTAPAITVGSRASVAEAARLMTENGIKRLPVSSKDTLVGIVTRSDLVKAFARSDDEIAREIREDVVWRTLWIEGRAPFVRVERGEVTLSGELERRLEAELLPRFVARVPGVVSVQSTVTWRWDDQRAPRLDVPHFPVSPR